MLIIISPCRDQREADEIRLHVASVVKVEHEHRAYKGPHIFSNRNRGIDSLDNDYLQWDTDIRATNEQVEQITSHKDKLVGAAYKHRKFDRWCAGVWTKTVLPDEDMLVSCTQNGLISVPWVGAGFFFTPGKLLRHLSKPYFRHEFVGDDQTGEDVGFCIQAMRSGLKIWLDADCQVHHAIF